MTAHVHRFYGRVAVSLPGKGETVYLKPAEARKLARALNACSRDISSFPQFSVSPFATVEFPVASPINAHKD